MHRIHGGWNDSPDAVRLIDAHHNRMLSHLSPADRDRFFWKNAKAFYRL